MALTSQQEKFAQLVASGKTQADSYRGAYNVGENTKPETIQKRASELMSNGAVKGRVEELRKPIIDDIGITLKSHLERLQELSKGAEDAGQFSAAINAEIARAKHSGIIVEKQEPKQVEEKPIRRVFHVVE